MKYDIELDSKNKIIKVRATCLLNQEIRKDILLVVASQLMITHFSRVIIDLTEAEFNPEEPMSGALELTSYMRTIGIQPHVRFAFIYADSERHRKFFENVAQLDGFNLRYFKSIDQATAWLV